MSAESLEHSLAEIGIACAVHAYGRLAVLDCSGRRPGLTAATRRSVAALARAHEFTHVALDLGDPSTSGTHGSGD